MPGLYLEGQDVRGDLVAAWHVDVEMVSASRRTICTTGTVAADLCAIPRVFSRLLVDLYTSTQYPLHMNNDGPKILHEFGLAN